MKIKDEERKRFITAEEAISLLPESNDVHIICQIGMSFVGADWSKKEIIDKITKSDIRELTGPHSRSMNHGLVVYDESAKMQSDLLFIETDRAKLNAFDPQEEDDEDNA